MQLHISCHLKGIDLQPYITVAAKDPTSLQYQTAAFSHLSVKPPEANYLNYMFVNTAFKTLHNASGSQKENCNCWWSLQSTTEACWSFNTPSLYPRKIHDPEFESWNPTL